MRFDPEGTHFRAKGGSFAGTSFSAPSDAGWSSLGFQGCSGSRFVTAAWVTKVWGEYSSYFILFVKLFFYVLFEYSWCPRSSLLQVSSNLIPVYIDDYPFFIGGFAPIAFYIAFYNTASPVAQWKRIHLAMRETQEMWAQSLGQEDPLE